MSQFAVEYKYDVAFSFLGSDEQLAQRLSDLIQDRLSTFLYSDRQADLAGADGEDYLYNVFKNDARVVVVLYRDGWGKTPWTEVEERAIKDRNYDGAAYEDFVLFVPLDDDRRVPRYLGTRHIWVDLKRHKLQGVASIIEHRVLERGGESRPKSLQEKAARLNRERDREEKRLKYLGTKEAVDAADREAERLFQMLQETLKTLKEEHGYAVSITKDIWSLTANSHGYHFKIEWKRFYSNTLNEAYLRENMSRYDENDENYQLKSLKERSLTFDVDENSNPCWSAVGSDKVSLTAEEVVERFCSDFLELVHRERMEWLDSNR